MTRLPSLVAALFFGTVGLAYAQEPEPGGAPVAQVKCKDGTWSKAGRGACSDHGGIDREAMAPAPTKRTPATIEEGKRAAPETPATAAPAMVRCKDGTMAEAGRGACSHHGGIDKASAAAPKAVPGTAPSPPATRAAKAHNPKAELTTKPPATTPSSTVPTAKCKDGTLSHSTHHSGTCSGHGGVAEWLDGSSNK